MNLRSVAERIALHKTCRPSRQYDHARRPVLPPVPSRCTIPSLQRPIVKNNADSAPIMRRRASTSRGPPPSWFTCSPCAACRWRSEVPGSAGLQALAVPQKQNCRDGRSSDMRPCDLAHHPINANLPPLAYWTGEQSTPRA